MIVKETQIPGLGPVRRGKVRDVYLLSDGRLLIVATDRISAFDVVMDDPIPDKGRILNQISVYWFQRCQDLVPNHLISTNVQDFPPACQDFAALLAGRSMLVHEAKPLPIECIVRGYLAGSGWQEYQTTGAICGEKLPPGLQEAAKLPTPIFTPSTKAELGRHDENITFAEVAARLGADLAHKVRDLSLAIYQRAHDEAAAKGIIIADTKFEFGLIGDRLVLIDEVLTPDSSRFWPRAEYRPGRPQRSFDKQYLRDYLLSLGWNKQPPPPPLPAAVIANTRQKYLEALRLLTGQDLV
ncbi:MAG: phosphoribosylaminoimidazolesuccinocarboxamide synthase [Desulfobacca sp.]|uniref:phosphoribosylaminoimidazolesuccinocarboxamide synthase n=1 Tax=Desulfobacca sp. TaxID=2067990 RepID=UPI00404B956E